MVVTGRENLSRLTLYNVEVERGDSDMALVVGSSRP